MVTEAGSYLRLIDPCITQLKAQGPSRTCNESKEEEEKKEGRAVSTGPGPGPTPHKRFQSKTLRSIKITTIMFTETTTNRDQFKAITLEQVVQVQNTGE